MIKELIEELILYWLKFKAWLTPSTADDEVNESSTQLTALHCTSNRQFTLPSQ